MTSIASPPIAPTRAAGLGLATLTQDGTVLEVWFPHTVVDADAVAAIRAGLGDDTVSASMIQNPFDGSLEVAFAPLLQAAATDHGLLPGTRREAVVCVLDDLAVAPVDAIDVYLRLRLLSERRIQPHGASLDGAFGLLANVAWTDRGPVLATEIDTLRLTLIARGERLQVRSVDKFPRMSDHVVPSGVRIGDADRVRLGAHLAAGTTVMHEGFVNFNAGTLGAAMVEGRISAGVVVGDGSDLGGSASIMGTLSGGGTETIRVGEGCLIGANAGIGISLGDRCVVEAGLYVTGGTKVTQPDGEVVAARTLSGRDELLFRRNSVNGVVEVIARTGDWGALNDALHTN
ncbi:MAG: 2,3,4,5-tetrahydropyridine-2-carboxylate N-succinyltransferase [Nitriliruptoraceae bacterium]